jgi:uroporphyrinogen decarboxylase
MNNRERVLAAITHRQPDRVPYNVEFTWKAHAKMVEYTGDPDFAAKLGNCLTILGCEPKGSWQEVRPDVWRDQFGVEWDRHVDKDIGVVCNRLVTPENLATFHFPDPDDPSRYGRYDEVLAKPRTLARPRTSRDRGDRFVVVNYGFSLFERGWTLAGEENLLMAMATDKRFAHALLDKVLDFNLRIIDNVCRYEVDAMMFGDDWGYQRGVVMGPRLWREFIKPRIRQMYGRVKAAGKFVFIHSCGKVDGLFPDLIECGVDVFNPFQPEVIDVFDAKQRYGHSLSFYGGISTQQTLPYGTVAQVRDEVRRLLDVVGANGGYIAAPAHAIPGDARPENIAAMIEVLQNQ